jgi:hypothetical protein
MSDVQILLNILEDNRKYAEELAKSYALQYFTGPSKEKKTNAKWAMVNATKEQIWEQSIEVIKDWMKYNK